MTAFAPPIKLTGVVTAIEHGDVHAETEVVVKVGSIKRDCDQKTQALSS
jgi:hypothetical protein